MELRKMCYKVAALLSILSVNVHGVLRNHKRQHSVSSHIFRSDEPISYRYSAMHDYNNHKQPAKNTKPQRTVYRQDNSDPVRHPIIQYAPLPLGTKPKENQRIKETHQIEKKPSTMPIVHLIESGRHVYSTKAIRKKNHLEPRLEEDVDEHNHNYKSFIPGHNVEVLSPNRVISEHVDPFKAHEEIDSRKQMKTSKFVYYHKKQDSIINEPTPTRTEEQITTEKYNFKGYLPPQYNVKPPEYVYYQKKQDSLNNELTSTRAEEQPTTEKYSLLGYIPPQYNVYAAPKDTRSLQISYSLHNELAREKPLPSYQHGQRLHLNIARVYSIAKQLHKAPLHSPQANSHALKKTPYLPRFDFGKLEKPAILTRSFFKPNIAPPEETFLYPVKKHYL